ncbi:pleckstrin homology domain-containing family A member 7 isoform X4 [Colossoma macropomum]|uniref:pleckstrin homology domain-containing family A member 7 isoform X4 n=1 Tax=Colossoma macropomum TaxID=42526 RepID=UPI0018647333|nr:pleckstrin homology domain-containing family A member 7 isoform X4 [Colossoma macropomum]
MGNCCVISSEGDSGHEMVVVRRKFAWPQEDKAFLKIDSHNQRTTVFRHPVTGQLSTENTEFRLQEQPSGRMPKPQATLRPSSTVSEASTTVTSSTLDTTPVFKGSRSSGRVHSFGKRDSAIKRNPNVPVVMRGWIHKQDSSGMRLWRRKWFVLADYCLFYYKDSREENVLGSIPLPSYTISPVGPEDHISRKYAFKASHTGMRSYIYKHSSVIGSQAEHSGMRTYFFSADTQEDMNSWVRAMNQAALMQNHTMKRVSEESDHLDNLDTSEKLEKQAVPQINHIQSYVFLQAEASQSDRTELQKQEVLVGEEESRAVLPEMEQVRGKSPGIRTLEVELSAPEVVVTSQAPSCAPSRAASTLPASFRSGVTLEQNGVVEYQRGTTPHSNTPTHTQGRKSTLEQVENWVKVQKGEHRGAISSEGTLSRQNPPVQSSFGAAEAQQSMSKTPYHSPPNSHRQLTSDYKYAQDRISHFRAAQGQPFQPTTRDGTVWQLYEWQQRQQYRHASPTAPIYVPAPDYSTAVSSTRVNPDVARSVSVPPTPADIPPPGPPGPRVLSPRRPHTPAERVTVKPLEDRPMVEVPPSSSPRRIYSQKSATIERRSMPPSGYITHTVSAPSLHGKTPEELTLLLIQLRRHQAMMAGVRSQTLAHLRQLSRPKADDTYVQLKKDLEYLDLKMAGNETLKGRPPKPVKVAESDVDVKLSRLCEQDKILQELEIKLSTLKEDKDKLESVLDVSHQQMEQYQDQPAHAEKIAYQQRLLQEDLVHIRADISRVATEMERAWEEYGRLEQSVQLLREALQAQMNLCTVPQEKTQLKRELWRIEDVMAGLSSTKDTFKITIDSMQNPERKLVPSVTELPSRSVTPAEIRTPQHSLTSSPVPLSAENSCTQLSQSVPKWVEDAAPPRPPLPLHYSEDIPPAVPPLPKETSIIRHTSVRGLKRQSDERKRDRESSYVNGDCRVELRSYLSEPELPGSKDTSDQTEGSYRTLPNRGLSGSLFRLNQSTVSSYNALKRDLPMMERPKSALEQLYSEEPRQLPQRGRMSVEEQLERMKRHQRALVRERKRNLNQAERQSSSSRASSRTVCSDLGPLRREQGFDLQLSERTVQTAERQGQEDHSPLTRAQKTDEWLTVLARPMRIDDLEPVDFDLDLSRELSIPPKISIPKRFQETEPEEPLSQEEKEERIRNVQKIKNLLAKSSIPPALLPIGSEQLDFSDLDHVLQQQEQIMTLPPTLFTEAKAVYEDM